MGSPLLCLRWRAHKSQDMDTLFRAQQPWKLSIRLSPLQLSTYFLLHSEASASPRNEVNPASYACLLQRCSNMKALMYGMCIHDSIVRDNMEGDMSIHYKLIHMYAGCGHVQSAHTLFINGSHQRSVFVWNVVIRAYVNIGKYDIALHLFNQMICEGIDPDNFTMVCVISSCASSLSLDDGKRVHIRVSAIGFLSNNLVGNSLLNMYAKCGSLDDVKMVFVDMPERNAVTWTSMMDAFVQHGYNEDVLRHLCLMQGQGEFPDRICFLTILSACSAPEMLLCGKQIHVGILETGCASDVYLGTALVNMYGKCGTVEDAYRVFIELPVRNVVSWNSVTAVCTQFGLESDAIQLFEQMLQEGFLPDRVTFIHSLTACMRQGSLHLGRKVHVYALGCVSTIDVMLGTAIVNMYGKCSSVEESANMFGSLCSRSLVSWNVMLGILTEHGEVEKAFWTFCKMQQEDVMPDKFTFVNLLDSCSIPVLLCEGERLHAYIVELSIEADVMVGTALVTMYGKCNGVESAYRVFITMDEHNVVSWNAMISLHTQRSKYRDALHLFEKMHLDEILPDAVTFSSIIDACAYEGMKSEAACIHSYIIEMGFDSDVAIGNTLINMYGKLGSLEDATQLFKGLCSTDVLSWTAMITIHVQHGCHEAAIQLFETVNSGGFVALKETFLVTLEAYADLSELAKAEVVYVSIVCKGLDSDPAVATALVNMYGKCGSPNVARTIFELSRKKDVILWTAIITVHAQHGYAKDAELLFVQMQDEGFVPNRVTFLNVLTACSHGGLVSEGEDFFASMIMYYGIPPTVDHYDCMIDLFGRAGLLEKAENFIVKMPFPPRIVSFMALLSACKCQDDMNRGERIAMCVFDLNPEISAPYVMLSNIMEKSNSPDIN